MQYVLLHYYFIKSLWVTTTSNVLTHGSSLMTISQCIYITNQTKLGLLTDSVEGSFIDGRLMCRFKRHMEVNSSDPESSKVFDLKTRYYFIVGSGPSNATGRIFFILMTVRHHE